ncbi:TPA: transposase [Bacillus cereus]|nr:transposase [Bacillus cereus]
MKNMRLETEKQLKKVIQSIHVKHKEYGYPRMKIALQEDGYFLNHKKVYRLMSELNIQSIIRKKRRFFKGNYSNIFPNILNREFKGRQQNAALVTDCKCQDDHVHFHLFKHVQIQSFSLLK